MSSWCSQPSLALARPTPRGCLSLMARALCGPQGAWSDGAQPLGTQAKSDLVTPYVMLGSHPSQGLCFLFCKTESMLSASPGWGGLVCGEPSEGSWGYCDTATSGEGNNVPGATLHSVSRERMWGPGGRTWEGFHLEKVGWNSSSCTGKGLCPSGGPPPTLAPVTTPSAHP